MDSDSIYKFYFHILYSGGNLRQNAAEYSRCFCLLVVLIDVSLTDIGFMQSMRCLVWIMTDGKKLGYRLHDFMLYYPTSENLENI